MLPAQCVDSASVHCSMWRLPRAHATLRRHLRKFYSSHSEESPHLLHPRLVHLHAGNTSVTRLLADCLVPLGKHRSVAQLVYCQLEGLLPQALMLRTRDMQQPLNLAVPCYARNIARQIEGRRIVNFHTGLRWLALRNWRRDLLARRPQGRVG